MRKIVSQIRDIDQIEKELLNNHSGVLALNIKDEKVMQLATTFLYQDKNVFFFLEDKDEFENINFESTVSFTIVKNDKTKKSHKPDFNPTYSIFSISVAGTLKIVDDEKLLPTLKKNYLKKYSSRTDEREKSPKLAHVFFIDTEEIQAFEEMGG